MYPAFFKEARPTENLFFLSIKNRWGKISTIAATHNPSFQLLSGSCYLLAKRIT